jgi:DNA-binding response OmpR family regulator
MAGLRVLIVDDAKDSLEMYGYYLRAEGLDVCGATSLADGLRVARESAPEVLVVDIHLPDGTGYTLLKTLRAEGVAAPAIALTGEVGPEFTRLADDAGFVVCCTKPCLPDTLLAVIRDVVGRRSPS